mmetsp:Transcript_7229/g.15436  ORF Transcript_7229/g.15436 Transcript_7229/m.15436 type:complete len:225 (-) Transcript_7229:211-885(-)
MIAIDQINHYKIVLLGEGRVGKTSVLVRYIEDSFVEGRNSTLQAAYFDKTIAIDASDDYCESAAYDQQLNYSNNKNAVEEKRREAKLSIWDTAGQERFHSLGPIYYRDARGAILVYDITDMSSFLRMKSWAKELRKMVGDSSKICLFIVGNKSDLAKRQRAVRRELAIKYAESVGADFLEVSAKTGDCVDDIFVGLTKSESYFHCLYRVLLHMVLSRIGLILYL